MKQIELSKQGKHKCKYFAIVDDEDYEIINKKRWCVIIGKHTIYAKRTIKINNKRVCILMHNVISGAISPLQTDHINHNGLDNRKENLRVCSQSENNCNKKEILGKVKYHGVTKYCKNGKTFYVAFIKKDKKSKNLGTFKDPIEAAKAYDKAAILLFGEFARLNFK